MFISKAGEEAALCNWPDIPNFSTAEGFCGYIELKCLFHLPIKYLIVGKVQCDQLFQT